MWPDYRLIMTHDQGTALDANTRYRLGELEIALDPSRPEYCQPVLSSSRVGVVDVGCGMGQLFVARADGGQAHGGSPERPVVSSFRYQPAISRHSGLVAERVAHEARTREGLHRDPRYHRPPFPHRSDSPLTTPS